MSPEPRDFRRRPGPKSGTGPLAFKKAARRAGQAGRIVTGTSAAQATPESVARRIRRLEIRTDRLVRTILGGEYRSVFKGRGMQFDEVREYQEGDDPRTIDWNVTARMDRLFVKKYVEERELTVILAVDISASLDFATAGEDLKRDLAAKFAMAIALTAIANNDRVGLFLFTDGTERFIPPRRGRTHGLRLIRDMLAYRARGRQTDFTAAAGALARLLCKPATVFVCSDFLASDLDALKRLTGKHDVVAVTLADRAEEDLPELGLVEFRDPETGQQIVVDTGDRGVREHYREKAQARRRRRQAAFRAMGVDEVELYTHESFLRPLFAFFRQRGSRRVRRRAR
ncbi:MAG: DUF58 domain-containing protein [Candidatus Sericytochromatia bacterium]|nr:DUF58 domain-containing protein [Candidatus Tanganyikabacteria bacterium]